MIIKLSGATFTKYIGTVDASGTVTKKDVTLTIIPNPSDATVTLTASGYQMNADGKSITVPYGTIVSYEVSKTGYVSKSGTFTVMSTGSTMTQNITLRAVGSTEPDTGRLPSEYQEVEYLKTSETQYFVLGEVSSNVIYEIKFRSNKLTTADGLIGCYSSTDEANRSQIRISCQKDNAGKTYDGIEFMYGGEGSVEKANVATTQFQTDYWTSPNTIKVDANKFYWNGELKITRTAFTSNTLATPFTLFAQNNNNAASTSPGFGRQAAVECYYVKIQDTSKSINKELIPCYRKSDNVIGFYDIIGGAFITPTSGTITEKGPNV